MIELPHPHRHGTFQIDPAHVSAGVAETLRCWAADWARLTTEAPFRATLSRRLLTIAERAQRIPLDQLVNELRDLATDAELARKRGRIAAWKSLSSDERELAA